MQNTSVLSPHLAQRLFVAVLVTTLLGVGAVLVDEGLLVVPGGKVFSNLFNLNKENTFPAWFSSALLLVVSYLALLVSKQDTPHVQKHRRLWQLFALLFCGLSLDESAGLHERLQSAMESHGAQTSGLLKFVWVVPALLLVAALAVAYLRFVRDLEARTRLMLVAAGLLYVGGAAGMEMVDGWALTQFGNGPLYLALTVVEEFLEMSGAVLCIATLQRMLLAAAPALFGVPAARRPLAVPRSAVAS